MLLFMPIMSHLNGPFDIAKDVAENKVNNPEEAKIEVLPRKHCGTQAFAIAL